MSVIELRTKQQKLERVSSSALVVIAGTMGAGVYAGLESFAGHGDLLVEIGKGALAVSSSVGTFAYGEWLLQGVSRMLPDQRRQLWAVNGAAFLAIINVSTYTVTAKFGQEIFTSAHIGQELSTAASSKDVVVGALRRFESLGADTAACDAEFKGMAEADRRGAYSGVAATTGPLITFFENLAAQCATVSGAIGNAGRVTSDLVARMEAAVEGQLAAAADTAKPLAERVLAIRNGSEKFRGALVEAGSKLPISVVEGLARSLSGRQAEPALSANPRVATGQAKGIAEARKVTERYAAQLSEKVGSLSRIVATPPPAFSMPSPSQLVIKHWYAGWPIIAMAVAIDCLIFILYAVSARVNDAIREHEQQHGGDAFEEVHRLVRATQRLEVAFADPPSPIGPHPFPIATGARANGKGDAR